MELASLRLGVAFCREKALELRRLKASSVGDHYYEACRPLGSSSIFEVSNTVVTPEVQTLEALDGL